MSNKETGITCKKYAKHNFAKTEYASVRRKAIGNYTVNMYVR